MDGDLPQNQFGQRLKSGDSKHEAIQDPEVAELAQYLEATTLGETSQGGVGAPEPLRAVKGSVNTAEASKEKGLSNLLFRVVDDCSRDHDQFPEAKKTGLTAKDSDSTNPINFESMVKLHMEWANREPTPFISVVERALEAARIAEQRVLCVNSYGYKVRRKWVGVVIIDRDSLVASPVHKAWDLVQKYYHAGSADRPTAQSRNEHEFLVEHCIPASAIVRIVEWTELPALREGGERNIRRHISREIQRITELYETTSKSTNRTTSTRGTPEETQTSEIVQGPSQDALSDTRISQN